MWGGRQQSRGMFAHSLSLHQPPKHVMAVSENVTPLHKGIDSVCVQALALAVRLGQPDRPLEVTSAAIPGGG